MTAIEVDQRRPDGTVDGVHVLLQAVLHVGRFRSSRMHWRFNGCPPLNCLHPMATGYTRCSGRWIVPDAPQPPAPRRVQASLLPRPRGLPTNQACGTGNGVSNHERCLVAAIRNCQLCQRRPVRFRASHSAAPLATQTAHPQRQASLPRACETGRHLLDVERRGGIRLPVPVPRPARRRLSRGCPSTFGRVRSKVGGHALRRSARSAVRSPDDQRRRKSGESAWGTPHEGNT